MDPTKLSGIAEWPTPHISQRRSLIPRICELLQEVHRGLLKHRKTPHRPHKKGKTMELVRQLPDSLQQAKRRIRQGASLDTPRSRQTIRHRNGRIYRRLWRHPPPSRLKWTCSYLSQSFSPADRNYDVYDRELLAVIRGLKTWKHYLRGSQFPVKVFTDHKNLLYFKEPQKLNRRQARWMLNIGDYNLKLVHVPGKNWLDLTHNPDDPILSQKKITTTNRLPSYQKTCSLTSSTTHWNGPRRGPDTIPLKTIRLEIRGRNIFLSRQNLHPR